MAQPEHSSAHHAYGWERQIAYTGRGAACELQRGGDHSAYIDALAALSQHDYDYPRSSHFSRSGLIEQLEYEGYTHAQAVYGVDKVGALTLKI